jgi:plastocyanin
MTKNTWITLLTALFVLAMVVAGCGKKEEKQESSQQETKQSTQAAATPIDPNTVATVSGDVKFDGTAPKPQKIDMSQDPACKGTNETETIEANGGKLANVFVYVKDGLGDRTFAPPKDAVTIDQNGCRYHPHVLGVMAGQPVTITNSDNTTHNIHPSPKDNREWNESQPPKGAPLSKEFARPEVLIPVKCNQHPWMKMFIGVSKSPFFAVTDKSGKYELKGLPPGTYTIAAVHEKLGEKDQQITVGAKDSKTADFTFSGSGAPAGGQ